MGAPDVSTALLRSVVMSALGAGEKQYTNFPDPKTYKVSLDSPDAHLWAQARTEEINSLESNRTWEVVKREKHMHVLRNKWVLKKKMDGSGSVERYKARLVAGGDNQVLGRDYNLTFAAVILVASSYSL